MISFSRKWNALQNYWTRTYCLISVREKTVMRGCSWPISCPSSILAYSCYSSQFVAFCHICYSTFSHSKKNSSYFCHFCDICYFFYTFLIAVFFQSCLLNLRKQFASKFLLTRSILDISDLSVILLSYLEL